MNCNFTPFPQLTTERLVLRRMMPEDDKEIFFQRSDRSMNQFVDNPPAKSIEEAREWITKINNSIDRNELISWGIAMNDAPKLIGGFCFWNLSEENDTAEIGFGLIPSHRGKGLMHETLQAAIRYGFEEMELKTIEAYTHPQNIDSIKLLEKNNFILTNRQSPGENYIIFELHKTL